MADRTGLLESALDCLAEGMALVEENGRIALWSQTAEAITGYASAEMVGHGAREMLDAMLEGGTQHWIKLTNTPTATRRGSLVHVRHKCGQLLPLMARVLVLRDGLGARIGTGAMFHPAESIDAVPHGEVSDDSKVAESQTELEDRLASMHDEFLRSDVPLGVLWVTVDQARELRRTHGARAWEAMLEKMERTLASALKPAEEIGRWGDDEFLILSHERSVAMLAAHGQVLAGMARTTDFRWWGDRISLTVSIGAAQAERGEMLIGFLDRAQAAMLGSVRSGGNHITAAQGCKACSPS